MTDDEWAVSRSTPLCRFDAPAPAPAPAVVAAATPAIDIDPAAARVVAEIVEREPVVMFALEWCEFCWSVRKFFKQMGIAYRSVDVDSVKYQEEDLGGKIRGVLAAQTGAKTLPQVFVGGVHIGGATDVFDAWRAGSLQKRLDDSGVLFDHETKLDPYLLLPKWLQPRKSA
jgi:cysteine synthase A